MKTKWIKLIFTCMLIFTLSACAAPLEPTVDANALGTIVAQNVQLTQLAATLTEVIAQQSATPAATATPNVTATFTPTPTETATPTKLSGVWLTLDQTTNCRLGPGTYYPVAATIEAGNQLQAIARSEDGEWFYLRYFDTSNHYCWIWRQTSYLTGDPNWVPMYTTQPTATTTITPTSAAGFTVSYNSLQTCSSKYALSLNLKNTGWQTWQSIKIVIVDNTTGTTVTHTADKFTGYTGCNVTQDQGDLTTNETGLVTSYNPGEFTYDPTGHLLGITVSLYSEKGQAGTVITKSISATP